MEDYGRNLEPTISMFQKGRDTLCEPILDKVSSLGVPR
jgi:hypothetical protein